MRPAPLRTERPGSRPRCSPDRRVSRYLHRIERMRLAQLTPPIVADAYRAVRSRRHTATQDKLRGLAAWERITRGPWAGLELNLPLDPSEEWPDAVRNGTYEP